MTLGFVLGLFFLFIQLAFNMTAGYVVHYATFMASRTYLTHDNSGGSAYQAAEEEARSVFNSYKLSNFNIDNLEFVIRSPQEGADRYEKFFTGAVSIFSKSLSLIKLIGGDKEVNYLSESFLGKEPTRRSCLERICEIIADKVRYEQCRNLQNGHHTLFDNGC